MEKIIIEKDYENEKSSRGILEVIRNHRKKLSIGLGAITITSGMLLSSGCSSNNEKADFKTETTTTVEDINDVEEFDPSKCEIEEDHKHLCTWEEIRKYPNEGEIITKFQYWCKDSEIESLRSEHSDSNFKVVKHTYLKEPKEIVEFDPDKCEIEMEHRHLCSTGKVIEVTVDKDGNIVEKISEPKRWCTDEEIKFNQEKNSCFKVYDEHMIYVNSEKQKLDTNKVLVNVRR